MLFSIHYIILSSFATIEISFGGIIEIILFSCIDFPQRSKIAIFVTCAKWKFPRTSRVSTNEREARVCGMVITPNLKFLCMSISRVWDATSVENGLIFPQTPIISW